MKHNIIDNGTLWLAFMLLLFIGVGYHIKISMAGHFPITESSARELCRYDEMKDWCRARIEDKWINCVELLPNMFNFCREDLDIKYYTGDNFV